MSTWGSRWRFFTCLCAWSSVGVAAPRRAAADDGSAPVAAATHPDRARDSAGVRPTPAPRGKARRRAKGEAVVTFPGFRLLSDGRSRVFVELSKTVVVEERHAPMSVIYTLRGANVPVRNNRNALVTTNFPTAVARARLVPTASDVELVIELRAAVSPTHQLVSTEAGGARLEVEFPAGDYPLAPPRDPGAPPAGAAPMSDDVSPASGEPAPARGGEPARLQP